MTKHQALLNELATLEAERIKVGNAGVVLFDCWVAQSGASGTARTKNLYWQVRSRQAMFGGKKSKYLKAAEVAEYEVAIARGKRIKALDKEIAKLRDRINKLEALLEAI